VRGQKGVNTRGDICVNVAIGGGTKIGEFASGAESLRYALPEIARIAILRSGKNMSMRRALLMAMRAL